MQKQTTRLRQIAESAARGQPPIPAAGQLETDSSISACRPRPIKRSNRVSKQGS